MNFLAPYLGIVKAIAIIAAALALFGSGHHFGAQGVQADWSKETAERKIAESAAILTGIKNNERIADQQETDRQKLKKGHADEIAQIRAAYATDRGLRINAKLCTGFAGTAEAKSTSGSDERTAAYWLLPEAYDRDIKSLGIEYETAIAGCRVAQEFISDNGMAP
jgi:hypothetical protein